jgi:hypothetical protein
MNDSGASAGVTATVEEGWVQSDNPMAAVSASLKVVLSDEEVLTMLGSGSGGDKITREFDKECYTTAKGGGLSIGFDFTGCAEYGLEGTITVTKILTGPIVITFNEGFEIKDIAITGSLALTHITGELLTFTAFNSDAEGEPGTAITVENTKKSTTAATTYDGKVKVVVSSHQVLIWGVTETTEGNVTNTYYFGGESEEAVAVDDPPAGVVTYDYSPLDCYCPSTGVISGAVNLNVTEVTFDLDNFTRPNNADDYPAFSVPVSIDITGSATVTFSGCGEYSLAFEADSESSLDVSVSKDKLLAALETAKKEGKIKAALYNTMKGIINGFDGTGITIEASGEDLVNALTEQLAKDYDVSFCEV